ncbi:REH1 (YLR387C) [Zygosaccharomyces parabailii]|nr:REH1 (YLR387C) [Zygosaccharomyces parabailii]SJM86897.1 related to Zinc finger protein REH1 [Zygosaccharomyces bailii]
MTPNVNMVGPSFTCNSCVIQFKSSDLQRYHMKTEWHRYNLKRRVAGFPPISADLFAEKLQVSEREKAENQVDEFGFAILKPLNVPRGAPEAKKSSHGSKRRTPVKEQNTARVDSSVEGPQSLITATSDISDSDGTNTDFGENTVSEYGFTSDSNWDSESEVASIAESDRILDSKKVTITDCIYCGRQNREVDRNINHMFQAHGLYIPERSYLVDLQGLLNFLIQEIAVKKLCLCCNFQGFSLESIRNHMHSKRHCKMPYETKEEREKFARFYNFTSLEEPDTNVSSKSPRKIHFENMEGESTEEDMKRQEINSNYTTATLDDTGLELTLPNGTRVCHRIGQRYFRQNLPMPQEPFESRSTVSAADRRLASGITEKQWKQGIRNMQHDQQKAMNRQLRRQKSNKLNYQPHYRDELLQ